MQTNFQESEETAESNRLEKDLRQGGCLQGMVGRLVEFKEKHWKGHLFWIPGGKTFGGDVGFPIEILRIFYPNPWVMPINCFALSPDGKRLSFDQFLKLHRAKSPNDQALRRR